MGVEVGEIFFGASGLPDVKGFAVSLLEGGGDPVLARELLPRASPASLPSFRESRAL